jgi:hypothetical protein
MTVDQTSSYPAVCYPLSINPSLSVCTHSQPYFDAPRKNIMISLKKLATLTIGNLLTQSCSAVDNVVVQADIVFPKNNTSYKPTYPFPIVFALINFADVWQYKPVLNWRLLGKQSSGDWGLSEEGSMGWTTNTPYQLSSGPLLAINSSHNIIPENLSSYALQYDFRLGPRPNDCSGPGFQPESSGSVGATSAFFTGRILFNISNITGIVPDIEGSGECGTPLGAVGYAGPNETNSSCPLLSWPRPKPKTCAYTVNAQSASQVTQAMGNQSHCKALRWPSFTNHCPASKSESRRLNWNNFALCSIIFVLSFILL